MTTDTSADTIIPAAAAPPPTGRIRRRLAAAATVGGAVSLVAGRLLTLPGGTPEQRLDQAAGHQGQIAAELVLVVFGLVAMAGGLVAVAGTIRARGRTLATIGAAGCLLGCGLIVQMSLDAVYGAAARVGAPAAMTEFVRQLDASPAIAVVTPVAVVGYFFGPWLITLAARRARLVPGWLPWGVLVALPLQSVGEGLKGPFFANVADAVLQLVLVVMLAVLVRGTLLPSAHRLR